MAVNENLHAVTVFVRELWQAGVRQVCISPGSRSTPLTMAMARDGRYQIWTLLDERSAAFFAVGLARKSGQPVALVCTSGTATGNYLPAVMEAHEARLPLIVLTADRPPELHQVGSNQTVDQSKLYGTFAKWAVDMPVPEADSTVVRHAASTAWRAASVATAAPAGPVHINFPFREPLIPPRDSEIETGSDATYVHHVYASACEPSESALAAVSSLMSQARKPLIVCGPMDIPNFSEAAAMLADKWGAPILADPLSQLRSGLHNQASIIDTYDTLLRIPGLMDAIEPDLILRFGQAPTSKALGQFLSRKRAVRQVVVDVGTLWRDPFHTATDIIQADPSRFCQLMSTRIEKHVDGTWLQDWLDANARMRQVLKTVLDQEVGFEGRVFLELRHLLPAGSTLFVGNSMPVRDLDSFYFNSETPIHMLCNRGVSGIDGVVSSALGASAGTDGPVVLVIGDVSFYHDLNGLLAAKKHNLNLTVILVNNDGGGIFSFLPQAEHPDTFEHFHTSHGLDFQPAVEMYGGQFSQADTWSTFDAAVSNGIAEGGLHVIQLRTDDQSNVEQHRRLYVDATVAMEGHRWLNNK